MNMDNLDRSVLPIPDRARVPRRDERVNGLVNWVQIDLGEDADHLIAPEERLRAAMARGATPAHPSECRGRQRRRRLARITRSLLMTLCREAQARPSTPEIRVRNVASANNPQRMSANVLVLDGFRATAKDPRRW